MIASKQIGLDRTTQLAIDPLVRIQTKVSSSKAIEDDSITLPSFDLLVQKEVDIERRLALFSRFGLLHSITFIDLKQNQETPKPNTLNQLLQENALKFIKHLHDEKKHKQFQTKKLIKAIEKYWELKRTATQRKQKAEQKSTQKLARLVSMEIKKKWKLVEEICRSRYKMYLADVQKIAGEKNLDRILENSSKMLGGSLDNTSESDPDESNESDDSHESENELDDNQKVNDKETDLKTWMEEYDPKLNEADDIFDEDNSMNESNLPVTNTEIIPDIGFPIPFLLKHTLREYQYEGMKWLANLYYTERNGILADEMGLGMINITPSLFKKVKQFKR